jgi:hypothetical protein
MSKNLSRGRKLALLILLLFLFTTACQQAGLTPIATQSESVSDPTETVNTASPDNSTQDDPIQTTEAPENAPTLAQPTPAPTLADWRDAPIEPEEISERVVEIYQEGQRQGRDPLSFSVIGDCQSIPYVFMGPFGRGILAPDASESYLWDAINAFGPSFDRWSVTARGGFTAASILNALQADTEECKPGETPLTCEFRLNNPAFVLITLETWLDPETIDRYEVYLRQILDTVIEKGAVPILLTKADSSELRGEKHVINPVIVNLAYEYQVPVVNFWQAAQYLDNFGIDPEREGFHLSQAGYNLKNILALRALYATWMKVSGEEAVEAADAISATENSAAELGDVLNPAITPPNCAEGCVFFGSQQSLDGSLTAQGVYAYQIADAALVQVLPQGYDLQDASEDGLRLLVNAGGTLMTVDLETEETELVSEAFNAQGNLGAYWNTAEDDILYLDIADPIQGEDGSAYSLIPAPSSESLYFNSGSCESKDYCDSEGAFELAPDGTITPLSGYGQPVFSPDGQWLAYVNPDAATADNYYHIHYMFVEETAQGIGSRRPLYFQDEPGFEVYPEVQSYTFSPDSSRLFILYNVYSEYYERSLRLQTYMWDAETGIVYDFGKLDGVSGSLNPRYVWSPDGSQILLFMTSLQDNGDYQISLYQTDLTTGEKMELVQNGLFTETEYFYLTNAYWR